MALYVTRPRRDEERIGRGLPSGAALWCEPRDPRLPVRTRGFRLQVLPLGTWPLPRGVRVSAVLAEYRYLLSHHRLED